MYYDEEIVHSLFCVFKLSLTLIHIFFPPLNQIDYFMLIKLLNKYIDSVYSYKNLKMFTSIFVRGTLKKRQNSRRYANVYSCMCTKGTDAMELLRY